MLAHLGALRYILVGHVLLPLASRKIVYIQNKFKGQTKLASMYVILLARAVVSREALSLSFRVAHSDLWRLLGGIAAANEASFVGQFSRRKSIPTCNSCVFIISIYVISLQRFLFVH